MGFTSFAKLTPPTGASAAGSVACAVSVAGATASVGALICVGTAVGSVIAWVGAAGSGADWVGCPPQAAVMRINTIRLKINFVFILHPFQVYKTPFINIYL
jgi:uncharacterized metal-binding protein